MIQRSASPSAVPFMTRRRRLGSFAVDHLRTVAKREWQLGLLALIALAPGVATLLAWTNLAIALRDQRDALLVGWLLPKFLMTGLGAAGMLVGAGLVTLLIGCLGLTNAYLASLERRLPALLLLRRLGLRRRELLGLLALEPIAIGLLGSGVGVALGLLLSWLTWQEAATYLALPLAYQLTPLACYVAVGIGLLAVLLFLHTAARLMLPVTAVQSPESPFATAQGSWDWPVMHNSWLGAGYGVLLALLAGMAVLPMPATLLLALVTGVVGTLLNGGGWLLTRLYLRLPLVAHRPLWALAVQGLARHPNHTAGMTLAMAAGAYAVGLALLSWLASAGVARFPFWVAGLVLVAAATLVFTVAALAVWERRTELTMLRALGARQQRLRQLIRLEYGIVAMGGGGMGALLALGTWTLAGSQERWPLALLLILLDLIGALLTAWAGALPALRQMRRGQ